MISALIGGIGIFLLGMILLTESLKALAGDALRKILSRFTGGAVRATLSGAAAAAIVQSSSATTVATIGFVSAGLLSFHQALGVIIGSNLGTTSTGWIVSLLGLKFNVGVLALPLVGAGALLRLLGKDRTAAAGMALAGFGLVFVGIDTLRDGMAGLAERIDLSGVPGSTISGRILLALIGAVMTVVLQSSSAAVTATLAALHAGALSLDQAAVLVIGQNVGTTVKAALVCIGASTPARRAALGHILFNLITGVVAFAVLPVFVALSVRAGHGFEEKPGAVALAAFHTAFNVLGALIFLPALRPFARLIERLVPDRGAPLTKHLDPSVAGLGSVAVEAARRSVRAAGAEALRILLDGLAGIPPGQRGMERLDRVREALDETERFLGGVRTGPESEAEHRRHVSTFHALDHAERFERAVREAAWSRAAAEDPAASALSQRAAEGLRNLVAWLESDEASGPIDPAKELSTGLAEGRRRLREDLLLASARGGIAAGQASEILNAVLWLDRATYHAWRLVHHLHEAPAQGEPGADPASGPEPPAPEGDPG
jgi:phosphate:Na+ symporter